MPNQITIGYLTGSAKVIQNRMNSDDIEWRKPRTAGQMFFQPYESKKEFIYCARHTFLPMAMIGLTILDPTIIITTSAIVTGMAIGCATGGGLAESLGKNGRAAFDITNYLFRDLCQLLIDIVVFPLSALMMLTRGISTGLHAAGIVEEVLPQPTK